MESEIIKNQVLNRAVIENIGFLPWRTAFARNKFERVEALMDSVSWWVIGLALPLLIQIPLTRHLNPKITKQYQLSNKTPIAIGLEKLNWQVFKNPALKRQLCQELGLKNAAKLRPLMRQLTTIKLGMIFIDLFFMGLKQQLYFAARNWFTERWSHKKGFSGTFNLATDKQQTDNAKALEHGKKKREKLALIGNLFSVVALPLMLLGIMSRAPKNTKSIAHKLKSVLPFVNYHKGVYLTKWLMLWLSAFGWNLSSYLYARDNNERRETITRSAFTDFFFVVGDDLFSGLAAWMFQKRHQKALDGVKLYERKWLGVPIGRMLDEVMVDAQKTGKKSVIALADQLARWHFRIGILTTSLFLGIGLTLMNNQVTKRKVLEEQKKTPPLNPKVSPEALRATNTSATVSPQGSPSINLPQVIYPSTRYQNPLLQDSTQTWAFYYQNLYGQPPSGVSWPIVSRPLGNQPHG
ncbi:MAG: hypothetical protein VKK59_05350 [Vampirovibrionales bacterium]|nr:hypothetical protein [Vampirovibrionales bacterium]